MNGFIEQNSVLVICIIIWEMLWKMIALWRAARKQQLVWFIVLGLVNTVGILPIIYLLTHKKAQ